MRTRARNLWSVTGGILVCQPVTIEGQTVERVGSFKYLGTILDTNLNFNEHTGYIFKKAM